MCESHAPVTSRVAVPRELIIIVVIIIIMRVRPEVVRVPNSVLNQQRHPPPSSQRPGRTCRRRASF